MWLPGFVNQSQLGAYFLAADALVMPSLHETWGLVVNEAMHFGMPVVVSDRVGSAADLVRPGETGLIYPAGNVSALARCLEVLSAESDGARRMGRAARDHVEKYTIAASARGIWTALDLEPPHIARDVPSPFAAP